MPSVNMTLQNMLFASYALPASRLQSVIPKGLALATADNETAFISLVIRRNAWVKLGSFSMVSVEYHQFDMRTYVTDPVTGQLAVYFIRTGVNSRLISIAANALGVPWRHIKLLVSPSEPDEPKSLSIVGVWGGPFEMTARVDMSASAKPEHFKDKKAAVDFLIKPSVGLFGEGEKIGRFTSWQDEVEPENWLLGEVYYPWLSKLKVVNELNKPHSVFHLPGTGFSATFPKKLSKAGK